MALPRDPRTRTRPRRSRTRHADAELILTALSAMLRTTDDGFVQRQVHASMIKYPRRETAAGIGCPQPRSVRSESDP
jgi:hypothetical protein